MYKSYVSRMDNENRNNEKTSLEFHTMPNKVTIEPYRIAQPSLDILRSRLQFIAKKMVFRFKDQQDLKIETRSFLIRSLFLLLIEYIIYLAFQLVSYFALEEFWRNSKYIPGIILGITYIVLVCLLIFLINKKHKTLLFILKALEFLTAFFLMGYLVAFDVGTMSLSYIIIVNIIIIYLTVI